MTEIEYSVVIRTTGNAGEKYRALLRSIAGLAPAPAEVIVVLPEGYALPTDQLGYERFCFSPKGMVIQRLAGLKACRTPYALVCDDDVAFPSDFVEKLYAPVRELGAAFSAAPLYSFLPDPGKEALLNLLMAKAAPTLLHRKDRYVSVLRSTGYSYNRHLDRSRMRFYETQSAAWTCFFADVRAFEKIEFDREIWLDAHGYSALDDQTMFYKAWRMGYKTIVVSNASYEHLDAGTSKRNNRPAAIYSGTFNRVVFWHRFVFLGQKTPAGRLLSRAAFGYCMFWHFAWIRSKVLRGRMTKEDYALCRKGFTDGKEYLKSEEYRELPPVR